MSPFSRTNWHGNRSMLTWLYCLWLYRQLFVNANSEHSSSCPANNVSTPLASFLCWSRCNWWPPVYANAHFTSQRVGKQCLLFHFSYRLSTSLQNHRKIIEWLGLEGTSLHTQLRQPRAPSNLALNTSRDGAPWLLWAAVPAPHLTKDGHLRNAVFV